MSIASEITSIGENLKKDYQAIANLGADLTNVDKNIENIAELLDGVYDNLPKTEYQEGTEINLGIFSFFLLVLFPKSNLILIECFFIFMFLFSSIENSLYAPQKGQQSLLFSGIYFL